VPEIVWVTGFGGPGEVVARSGMWSARVNRRAGDFTPLRSEGGG
jgi:hypothetical protein